MNEIRLVWVGRRATGAYAELAADYAARVSRHGPFTEIRVRPEEGRGGDPRRALAAEHRRIAAHIAPTDVVVALDERGRERRTEELARWLAESRERARTVFVIGSDLGLDPAFVGSARERLALSRFTLPHQLARTVLLEQLYRCLDLLAGGGYHRP